MIWDVIIVGAGPAGSSAAYDLAASGKKVLLLDKSNFPRDKPCGGGLTIKTIHRLRFDVSSVFKQTCTKMEMTLRGTKKVVFGGEAPICYMVERAEFDMLLLQKAQEKGAIFRVAEVRQVHQNGSITQVVCADGSSEQAHYVIAADGAKSALRRQYHQKAVVEQAFALEGKIMADHWDRQCMAIDMLEVGYGYGWVFPKGDILNVGVGTFDRRVKLSKQDLLDYVQKKLGENNIQHVVGYPLGLGYIAKNGAKSKGRMIFVGDAAGSVDALMGEGIHNAVMSGQIAALSIQRHINMFFCPLSIIHAFTRFMLEIDLWGCRILSVLFYRHPVSFFRYLSMPHTQKAMQKGAENGRTIPQIIMSSLTGSIL